MQRSEVCGQEVAHTAAIGGRGISCLTGFHRCKTISWTLTYSDSLGWNCTTHSPGLKKSDFTQHISPQVGRRSRATRDTLTCSHSLSRPKSAEYFPSVAMKQNRLPDFGCRTRKRP